jgi:signal peptidase II
MAMKESRLLYAVALIILLADIASKFAVRSALNVGESVVLLPFFSLTHIQNTGIAFGMLQFDFLRWVLVAVALGVAVAIAVSCMHGKLREHYFAWGLIAGGAVGNALDRIFIGTVTDFINFHFWPAFNVADSALTIGVVLLAWHAFRKE